MAFDRLFSLGFLALSLLLGSTSVVPHATEAAGRVPFTVATWRDGAFQRALERLTSLRVAKRAPFVKAYNQVLWSVLGDATPEMRVAVGRNRELYGRYTIRQYCDPWIALDTKESDFRQFVVDAVAATARLRNSGHAFMVVTTPSKASSVPDNLPRLRCREGQAPNRISSRLTRALIAASVPVVDGVALSAQAARKSPLPIFTRYGMHWNEWGAHSTDAAVLQLAAEQLGDARPRLDASATLIEEPLTVVTERDEVMGLYRGPRERQVPLATFKLEPHSTSRKATIVGDSFAEAMIDVFEKAGAFASIERFNYLTEFHESRPGGVRAENYRIDDIDWNRDVFGSDVVILEINEGLDLPNHARTFMTEVLRRAP